MTPHTVQPHVSNDWWFASCGPVFSIRTIVQPREKVRTVLAWSQILTVRRSVATSVVGTAACEGREVQWTRRHSGQHKGLGRGFVSSSTLG